MKRLFFVLFFVFYFFASYAQDCECEDKNVEYESIDELNSAYFSKIAATWIDYTHDSTVAPDLCPAQCWLKRMEQMGGLESEEWGGVSYEDIKDNADIAFAMRFFTQFQDKFKSGWISFVLPGKKTEDEAKLRFALGTDLKDGIAKIKEDKRKQSTPICRYGDCVTPLKDYYKDYYLAFDPSDSVVSCFRKDGIRYVAIDGFHTANSIVVITPDNIDRLVKKYHIKEDEYKPYFDTISFEILYEMTEKEWEAMENEALQYYLGYWSYHIDRLSVYDKTEIDYLEKLCSLPIEKSCSGNDEYKQDKYFNLCLISEEKEEYESSCKNALEYFNSIEMIYNPSTFCSTFLVTCGLRNAECISDLEELVQRKWNYSDNSVASRLKGYYLSCRLMLCDYLSNTTQNYRLREKYNTLLSLARAIDYNIHYSSVLWEEKWYRFLTNSYFQDFDSFKSKEDIAQCVRNYCKENLVDREYVVPCIAEYLCYYALYQIAHKTSVDPYPYMLECKNCCSSGVAYRYIEKEFAKAYLDAIDRKASVSNWNNLYVINEDSVIVNNENYYKIQGVVSDGNSILKVNGNQVRPSNGRFEEYVRLSFGINRITIECTSSSNKKETKTIVVNNLKNDPFFLRKDRALLFAVQEFDDPLWKNLSYPIRDAEQFATYLAAYGFDTCIVRNPTERDFRRIIGEYKKYYETDTNSCNQLLVFFAGHGNYDADYEVGYIILKDGKVPYSGVSNILDNMKCPHILAIFDACHSGSFFKSAKRNSFGSLGSEVVESSLRNSAKLCTRFFVGSGGFDKEVPDESKLMRTLFALFKTGNEYITYADIVKAISVISDPEPQGGDFGKSEPGAVFFFHKKKKGKN